MKIRLIALLAVVALSVMAVPASAHQGVGALIGTATTSPLGLPVLTGGNGTWSITADVIGTQNGTVNAAGTLHAVGGVGAACGVSNGVGSGSFEHDSIDSIEWITSAGGTLPVSGTWSGASGLGVLAGVFQAQGGLPCVSGDATSFQVVGAAAFL